MSDRIFLKNQLREVGLRVTKARVGVLEVLSGQKQPSEVAEILEGLQKKKVKGDLATVYRIMEKLVEVGLVKVVNFEDGRSRYELAGEHHHHLVCEQCGKVEAWYGECVAVDEGEVEQETGFKIGRHALEFFGTCSNCSS